MFTTNCVVKYDSILCNDSVSWKRTSSRWFYLSLWWYFAHALPSFVSEVNNAAATVVANDIASAAIAVPAIAMASSATITVAGRVTW